MKTKTIFNFLAFAMLMAAMVLTTACSGSDDLADNKPETTEPTEPVAKKGYELPVTINVTRQGDDATRASYTDNGDGTGSLSFSPGDQLFVYGEDKSENGAGKFAGTIEWQSGGEFSGTIYTEKPYTGTADALFTAAANVSATLLPDGYEDNGYLSINANNEYDAVLIENAQKSIANSKALAIEQLSFESAASYTSGTGFELRPVNAILNFTISALRPTKEVTATLSGDAEYTISGEVTTDETGKATFAMGVFGTRYLNELSLTVDGNPVTLVSSSKQLEAGKVYNITRYANTISGKFSVSATKQVYFSRSNLQATTYNNGTTWTWHFGPNQYARVGNGTANIYINGNGTVSDSGNGGNIDLFGWSTETTYLGINNSTSNYDYRKGSITDGSDFVDWGSHADVIAGIGSGWRTLTSDEWRYVTDTRSGNRFAKAQLNVGSSTRCGIILLPDDWNTSYYSLSSINDASIDFTVNEISSSDWTSQLEAHGAVFLPVTGQRNNGTTVNGADDQLHYWSSTGGINQNKVPIGNQMYITSSSVFPDTGAGRCNGFSVRLVCDVK